MEFLFWSAVGISLGCVFASFFEWVLDRFLMHRPVGKLTYPFDRHTLVHHRVFRADHTYHLIKEEDKHTIPMAWWNGPALVAGSQVPFLIWALFSGEGALVCGSLL